MSELSEALQGIGFDHAFFISADGRIMSSDEWVPSVFSFENEDGTNSEEIDSSNWEFVSHGMTGQYGYNGPVMHPSEFIGEAIADELVRISDDYSAFGITEVTNPDDFDELIGWVIIGKRL